MEEKLKSRMNIIISHINGFKNNQVVNIIKTQVSKQMNMKMNMKKITLNLQNLLDILSKAHIFQFHPYLNFYVKNFLSQERKNHFNMIEILIAISIIVTFSGLTGAVFARKYEESKDSNAKMDLLRIQEGLVMYFTKNSKYPLDLEQLVFIIFKLKLENGDLSKVPKDPWGSSYLYVPHIDWFILTRILSSKVPKQDELVYFIEAIKRLTQVLSSLPQSIQAIVNL
jgi:hypothetical protein